MHAYKHDCYSSAMKTLPKAGWYDDGSGRHRYWDGTGWTENYAPTVQPSLQQSPVPGRVSGFICGLLGLIFVAMPIIAVPLGVVGWVLSAKAWKRIPLGAPGAGLAIAGVVLSVCAISLASLLMLLAIPGAIMRNFG